MFNILKIILVIIVVGGLGTFYFLSNEDNDEIRQRTQEVIEGESNKQLSFGGSGRVSKVNVAVGDTVSKGQLLAILENEQKLKELEDAEAYLVLQEKILMELESGFTSEKLKKIKDQEAKVGTAGDLLEGAKIDLILILNEAFSNTHESIRNNIDQFIDNPTSANPDIIFSIDDSNLEEKIELSRIATEFILDNWADIVADLAVEDDLLAVSADAKNKLEQVEIFLDSVLIAVNSLEESFSLPQEVIDEYISDVLTAQDDIDEALADISGAEEDVKQAELEVVLEQQVFEQEIDGTNYDEVIVQEAIVEDAETFVVTIQTAIDETYIIAPTDGVVTEQATEVGDTVTPDEVVIIITPQEDVVALEDPVEPDMPQQINTTSAPQPTYFGPKSLDEPITIELPNGETLELWPGWR